MRKLYWTALLFLAYTVLTVGCMPVSPTAPDDAVLVVPGQLSPKGYWLVDYSELGAEPHNAGYYADDRLEQVQRCTGISYTPRAFHFKLKKMQGLGNGFWYGSQFVGGIYIPEPDRDPRIEVVGDTVWVIEWKHEMYHLLLDKTVGDPDVKHVRPEWTRCNLRNN